MDKHIAVLNELLRDLSENYPDMVTEDEKTALRAAIALMRGQSEEVVCEHSGCGRGPQANQVPVTLWPGDVVVIRRGALGAAMTKGPSR